jgi:hypothetical protein
MASFTGILLYKGFILIKQIPKGSLRLNKKKKHMKTRLFTCALVLGATILTAQTANQETKVRIKKIKNVNGVETVTDTTFTTNDPSSIKIDGHDVEVIRLGDGKEQKFEKVIVIDDETMEGGENAKVRIMKDGEDLDAVIEKALKEAGVDPKSRGSRKMVIVHDDAKKGDSKSEHKVEKIVMIKMDIRNASEEDKKKFREQIGACDEKLEMDKMNLYPNPSDGKFNLKFNLKNKEDAEVTVYDIQGKQVYNEKLPQFTGEYNKPIDISSNSKGVYFVKIQQGKHSQVKKIVME